MSDDDEATANSSAAADPYPWRFKPGVSGNPAGRPKGISLTASILKLLTSEDAERIVRNLIERATTDDVALKALIERTDGKVPQRIAGDPEGAPIVTSVTVRIEEPDQ